MWSRCARDACLRAGATMLGFASTLPVVRVGGVLSSVCSPRLRRPPQSTSRIHEGVDVRALRVDIPRVHSDAWRTVWCPRCPRGSGLGRSGGPAPGAGHPAVATRAAVAVSAHGAVLAARGAEGTDVSPPPARISGAHARVSPPLPTAAGGGGAVDDAISLATKLPWWNDSIASLSMKFMGHRVAAASSKNFLVEDRSRELGARALAWVHGCIARIFVLRACVLLREFMFMHTTLGFLSWYRVLCFRAALGSSATGTALYCCPCFCYCVRGPSLSMCA